MRPLLALLLLSACGRIGFDAGEISSTGDAPPGAFDPSAGTCIDAERGPFDEVAAFPTKGGGYGVWAAPPYVLVADTTGGLTSVRFDGTSFTETGHLDGLGWVEAVWSDGATYFVGAPGTGLAAVELGVDGALTLRDQLTAIPEARHGWFGGDLVYVPSGPDGVYAVRYAGGVLSLVGAPTDSMSWSQGLWARGTRVLLADADYLRLLDFDGAAFVEAMAPDNRHPGTTRVWSDGTRVFVAHATGVTAYRLEGNAVIELDTAPTTASARDVWSDGANVFVAAEADGVRALAFEGDRFTDLGQTIVGTQALGVFGDGTYVYVNELSTGLHAYRGFACKTFR